MVILARRCKWFGAIFVLSYYVDCGEGEEESLNSLEASLLNHFTISTGTYISLSLGQNLQNNYRETVVNGNIRW